MSLPPLNLDRTIGWGATALIAAFLISEFTPLDLWVQDRLFDFERSRWVVDGRNPEGRALFYTGPKVLIIAFAAILLATLFVPAGFRSRLPEWLRSRRRVILTIVPLGMIPTIIGGLKETTNVFCPSEMRRYGGDVPYVRVLESYPVDDRPVRRGRCFPAGHASGGFALFAAASLAATRRGQYFAIVAGLVVGSLMGGYQMAKGAHYLSHTLITALIAWVISATFFVFAKWEEQHERDWALIRSSTPPHDA